MPIYLTNQNDTTVISATAPSNPTIGSQWLEIDSSGNLIEFWNRFNNSWRSNIKSWINTATLKDNNVAFNFYKPLPFGYDYFVRNFLITACNINSQLTSSNFFRVSACFQRNNLTTSSPSVDINSQGTADYIVKNVDWTNTFISSANTNQGLRININKTSSLQGDVTTEYFYQVIRK